MNAIQLSEQQAQIERHFNRIYAANQRKSFMLALKSTLASTLTATIIGLGLLLSQTFMLPLVLLISALVLLVISGVILPILVFCYPLRKKPGSATPVSELEQTLEGVREFKGRYQGDYDDSSPISLAQKHEIVQRQHASNWRGDNKVAI